MKTSEKNSENLPLRDPLRDPLRGRFPSQRLSVLLPLIVLPLKLSLIPEVFLIHGFRRPSACPETTILFQIITFQIRNKSCNCDCRKFLEIA